MKKSHQCQTYLFDRDRWYQPSVTAAIPLYSHTLKKNPTEKPYVVEEYKIIKIRDGRPEILRRILTEIASGDQLLNLLTILVNDGLKKDLEQPALQPCNYPG